MEPSCKTAGRTTASSLRPLLNLGPVLLIIVSCLFVTLFITSTAHNRAFRRRTDFVESLKHLNLTQVVDDAYDFLTKGLEIERRIFQLAFLSDKNPDAVIAMSQGRDTVIHNISRAASIVEEVTRQLLSGRIDPDDVRILANVLPQMNVTGTRLEEECPVRAEPPCPFRKYRSYNGHCNNVENPHWGEAGTTFGRFLHPDYSDGISEPRMKSVTNSTLPSARSLSAHFYGDSSRSVSHVTLVLVMMSEFVANDVSFIAPFRGPNSEQLKCCGVKIEYFHPECFPIQVPVNDSVYHDRSCLEFVRSAPGVRTGCTLGPREQLNLVSSFLDGSSIYGNSEETAKSLRSFEDGQLRGSWWYVVKPRPPALDLPGVCNGDNCFSAGDARVNENAGLAAMHALWFREHNRVASVFSQLNPHWNDDRIFEETRRVVVAELQHIVYSEILPPLLGAETMERFQLAPRKSGYTSTYDARTDPSTTNEAAAAVFHFVMSMMPSHLDLYSTGPEGFIQRKTARQGMEETFYDPQVLQQRLDDVLLGLVSQGAPANDESVVPEMARPSFAAKRPDPIAKLIQRGRDHGLTSYAGYRRFCNLQPEINRAEDLERVMPPSTARKLMTLYEDVNDIDLLLGGLAEYAVEGAVLGPTFACLLGKQFKNLKNGDRFYYEHDIPVSRFSEAQLFEIRKSSLAQLLCNNADHARFIQPRPTLMPDDFLNAHQLCQHVAQVDFEPWRSRPGGKFEEESVRSNVPLAMSERDSGVFERTPGSPPTVTSKESRANGSRIETECDETILPCDYTTKYRSITGWCNNLSSPSLGKSFADFSRLAEPHYADGAYVMKEKGVTGELLPNPRLISTRMHYDSPEINGKYTLALMQWGQFLDHDLTFTPMVERPSRQRIDCKRCDSGVTVDPECRPIRIPSSDPFFPDKLPDGSDNCISFIRSSPSRSPPGAREQINQATAFLDASNVYGSTVCRMRELRSFVGGRLNSTQNAAGGKPLLPQTSTHRQCRARSGVCFTAGDDRASEQPALATMHSLFLRAHNFFVEGLSRVNPHWDDEKLFQEGRRIVSALMQRITYGEFLPRVLGRSAMAEYGLDLADSGFVDVYDPRADPTTFNEFAAAAFRFGHSLIAPSFKLLSDRYVDRNESLQLRKGFFDSDMLYEKGAIDKMLRGLLSVPLRSSDNTVTTEATNHLFQERLKPLSGLDLVALNIQRGRDHGLQPYNMYRGICGLKKARSFSDLVEIPNELRKKLKNLYSHVDDIDLFTGGMSERSAHGALVGPTFSCIIGRQFRRIKNGDRFFFETDDPRVRFTEEQLQNIRSMTLSQIICDNSDNIHDIQKQAFDQVDSFLNPRVPCSSMKPFNFTAWAEK